jgi:hypothetical protein
MALMQYVEEFIHSEDKGLSGIKTVRNQQEELQPQLYLSSSFQILKLYV